MTRQDSLIQDTGAGGPAIKTYTASMRAAKSGGRLIDEVRAACGRLADAGWRDLMKQHGLNIEAKDLARELAKPLDTIDRSVPGFEDFAWEGVRGIEPGRPAHSLLYHAFASPRVDGRGEVPLRDFPNPAEIEAVENYVYGARPPSIEELRVRAGGAHLAIVVFAAEYRPGSETVHRKHADMCYARAGITRVGTTEAEYLPAARGYLPFFDGDPHQFRVLPCRYAAYIAALLPGKKDGHGPMRFLDPEEEKPVAASTRREKDAGAGPPALPGQPRRRGDAERNFWIPLHKLFDGTECIDGRSLHVGLSANHVNEKIRRAHLFFAANGHDSGWSEPDISHSPFKVTDSIAAFSKITSDGSWLLMPFPHQPLIKAAEYNGKPLTYRVPRTIDPAGPWRNFDSALNLRPKPQNARAAPEYLHARHKIDENGKDVDLNQFPDVEKEVEKGGYRARHYQDFTGDGWIDVECSELALEIPRRLPAYSIVATPDFFPAVSQSALMEWTEQSVPPVLLEILWPENPGKPEALSDQRFAANLELRGAGFDPGDDTMTAIVGLLGCGGGPLSRVKHVKSGRANTLPDAAAGVFAPGWDVSLDRTPEPDQNEGPFPSGITFINTYGLGSPFVEDSKLCAALSSFWPAVAPDITRTFGPHPRYHTATPLTDDIIGLRSEEPWDGFRGPKVDAVARTVEYTALPYADYVQAALDNKFNIKTIGATAVEEYVARTLTMARVYSALKAPGRFDKVKWALLSFCRPDSSDPDFEDALKQTRRKMERQFTYRFEMIEHKDLRVGTGKDFKKVFVSYDEIVLLFADPSIVLHKQADGSWNVHELRR